MAINIPYVGVCLQLGTLLGLELHLVRACPYLLKLDFDNVSVLEPKLRGSTHSNPGRPSVCISKC